MALLAASRALSGLVNLEAVVHAIHTFTGAVAEANVAAAAGGLDDRAAREMESWPRCECRLRGRAVAQAVALARPEGHLRLPDLAADPHRRGLGELVKSGALTPCEFVTSSEFAAMSVGHAASGGACSYTATASQGLLLPWPRRSTTPAGSGCRS